MVYPNPATNQITLRGNENNSLGLIRIYDGSGKIVLQKFIGSSQTVIDIQKLTAGIYYIRSEQQGSAIKFIKE